MLSNPGAQATAFAVTDTKCYFVILSTKENANHLQQLESGLKE